MTQADDIISFAAYVVLRQPSDRLTLADFARRFCFVLILTRLGCGFWRAGPRTPARRGGFWRLRRFAKALTLVPLPTACPELNAAENI
jgi:hypothetical protein